MATLGLGLLAFAVAYFSPIEYTFADPWGNLPTAQAILEQGTIKLDAYADSHAIAGLRLANRHGGHLYSFFPLGTSLLTLPAVLAANLVGLDMSDSADNTALQRLLSALIVALSLPLMIAICRQYLPDRYALLVTVAFVFGSPVMSSIGASALEPRSGASSQPDDRLPPGAR
jgi:hypothetical protein